MVRVLLRDAIESLRFEDLPSNWTSFDFQRFSKDKNLWDYQEEAVKNAIKVLWKYYEDFADYQKGEGLEVNQERKKALLNWYKDNNLQEDLSIGLDKRRKDIYNLLVSYYTPQDKKISYEHFINRMCFWMATGSGKTIIIVKLIQVLTKLSKRNEVPSYDILILTHRDDLIEQLKRHVEDFNYANEEKINLKELKEYPEVKRQQSLFGTTVFYYRSDNLSDEQKEKIIDFKNYDNEGKWYIFLDEAHKGDREDSKRQHIYSILSRNGFLFNFSATFIDPRDIITCAFEFNLSSFINDGYGKHISILKQELRAFQDGEDYTGEEKQKVVLKSLIILTYVKKFYKEIVKVRKDLYHNPLLLTLVNSVNTEDADLKLFFREIEKIGKGKIGKQIFESALNELWDEVKECPCFKFEEDKNKKLRIDEKTLKEIKKEDILKYIYNSKTNGEIEVLIRPSNRQEMAFKLKTSDRPFALIKIGDVSGWLKDIFAGYEIQERFEDESYFENLNREDSDINILMGSRSFYEGWDSNRPNVINYINIGTGEDARKFILQSVGRGVRIEPIHNKRKRLRFLYNANQDEGFFNKIGGQVLPVETLFIFGTNRQALDYVIGSLENEKKKGDETILPLFEINPEMHKYKLLVPVYKESEESILNIKNRRKFAISEDDLCLIKKFFNFIKDDRIFLVKYNTEPAKIKLLRADVGKNNFGEEKSSIKNIDLLVQKVFDYYSIIPKEFKCFKELGDEINHFRNIKVYLKDITELKRKIDKVKSFKDPTVLEKEVDNKFDSGKITREQYKQEIKKIKSMVREDTYEYGGKRLRIKNIPRHYYLPLILSETEKIDFIKHIIKVPSEVKFVNDLEDYLAENENKLGDFDFWMFSKIDESLDEVYIPYYNSRLNRISPYYPDFIFWFKKGENYLILFVDPKGVENVDYQRKIKGYKEIFEKNNEEKKFNYEGLKVKIRLRIRVKDVSDVEGEYRKFAFDSIKSMEASLK